MESSPLIKAHDHAREASLATHTADTVVAVNEHALAAGEFATAARDTSSVEALRTLRLLEQHHERLSRLLRYSLEHPALQQQQQQQQQQKTSDGESLNEKDAAAVGAPGATAETKPATGTASTTTTSLSGVVSRGEFANQTAGADGDSAATVGSQGASSAAVVSVTATAAAHQAGAAAMASLLPLANQQRRYPPSRELSSSIANNLASARGIRSRQHRGQPAAPSVSNDQAPGSLEGQVSGSRAHMQNVLQQQQHQSPPSGKPSWVPPRLPPQQPPAMFTGTDAEDDDTSAEVTAKADEGFARFYNRFGSIINRLSAPLAFAGLPLIAEETSASTEGLAAAGAAPQAAPDRSQTQSPTKQRKPRPWSASSQHSTTAATTEPDLSQIYSKAALRAIGRDGALGGGGSANDSFYVVPKTGHTASYANILSFDQKEKRRLAASVHGGDDGHGGQIGPGRDDLFEDGDDDDFVDAKEHPNRGGSPTQSRRSVGAGGGGGSGSGSSTSAFAGGSRMHRLTGASHDKNNNTQHVLEELYTENQGLKDMLDKLSRRLHAFEASAQQSHMALQESMRLMRPGSPGGSAGSGTVTTPAAAAAEAAAAAAAPSLKTNTGQGSSSPDNSPDGLLRRTRELEDELARALRRLEASEAERARQEKTLQKYREKWEKLKAGAKARRDAQGGGGSPVVEGSSR